MILITRHSEGAVKTKSALLENKIPCLLEPLLEYHYIEDIKLDHQEGEILVLTSSNAIRALINITEQRNYTIIASGKSTAEYAIQQGFTNVITGGKNVQELVSYINKYYSHAQLLYISGRQTCYPLVDILTNNNIVARQVVVYEMHYSKQLTAKCHKALVSNSITGITFLSFNTAKVFIDLIVEAHLTNQLQLVNAYSLSANITTILMQLKWKKIYTSNLPTHESLINTIINNQCYFSERTHNI